METLIYFSPQEVNLKDIAACLRKAKIKVVEDTHEIFGNELIVHFQATYQGNQGDTYIRWAKASKGIYDFEPEQQAEFRNQCDDPTSFFWILYTLSQFPALSNVLEVVLKRFGGYIYLESQFFDATHIHEAEKVEFRRGE